MILATNNVTPVCRIFAVKLNIWTSFMMCKMKQGTFMQTQKLCAQAYPIIDFKTSRHRHDDERRAAVRTVKISSIRINISVLL